MQDRRENTTLMLAGLFLLTFSIIAMEISLNRLFSFIYTSGYVYIILSLGISGLGIGSVALYYFFGKIKGIFRLLIILPLITLALLFLMGYIFPVIALQFPFAFLMFMYIGMITAYIYKTANVKIHLLYGVDLIGAAAGSILSFYILQYIGAVNAVIINAFFVSLSIWVLYIAFFGFSKKIKAAIFLASILIITLSLFLFSGKLIRIADNVDKDMNNILKQGQPNTKIVETKWTAFGRTDLVKMDGSDDLILFIDGAAGTTMLSNNPNALNIELYQRLQNQTDLGVSLMGLDGKDSKEALVIGSGGGIDIVTLLASGINKITAVEINPDFIDIVKKYGEFNGNIYNDHPNVEIINAEGRSYVRNTDKKFDILMISLPLIKSLRSYNGYALVENYLYTFEAFTEYRNALKDNGVIIIVAHNNAEIFRLTMNALKSMENDGIEYEEAMKSIIIQQLLHLPVMVLKNSPFTVDESINYLQILYSANSFGKVNFIPNINQMQQSFTGSDNTIKYYDLFNNYLYMLSEGRTQPKDVITVYPFKISWISDNSPFFYNFNETIPIEILLTFFIGLIILSVIIKIYFQKFKNKKLEIPQFRQYPFYFILLGLSFMMVEIGIIQKFALFWGLDTLNLSIVLAVILLSTGVGSFVSGKIDENILSDRMKIKIVSIAIPIITIITFLISKSVLMKFEGGTPFVKVLFTILFIFPQFFLMGAPFPIFLKNIRRIENGGLIPWMIGFNSITTFIGGILSVIIAMSIGFHLALIIGGAFYILLFFSNRKIFVTDEAL